MPVPVVVVGNITIGGTGKTPLVAWLVKQLQSKGFKPGIVSRGYGGKASPLPALVSSESDPDVVGDEPVLLARLTKAPVVIDPKRARGCALLVDQGVDIIVSDDGLQHYALTRDVEWAVVDGQRWFGNGFLIPAGPMREPRYRLSQCDAIVVNTASSDQLNLSQNVPTHRMKLNNRRATHLKSSQRKPLSAFATKKVHAVAGVGFPQRFFDSLRRAGIDVIEHAFPDHADFKVSDIEFGDDLPILITEKDAVKLHRFNSDKLWSVNAEVHISDDIKLLKMLLDRFQPSSQQHKQKVAA